MYHLLPFAGTASHTTKPEVDMKDLDDDTRRELRLQLESNRDWIQRRYASFVVCLCNAVEAKGVSLKQFRLYLLGLSAFESSHKGKQPIVLDDVKAEIKKADSISVIFEVLTTECCSFINVGIFQSIISEYEINTASDKNLQYSEHLKTYLKNHKISEFIMINPKLESVPKGSEELILKFNIALPNEITKVLDLKSAIAKILGIRPYTLRLIDIEEGCVVVTFLIPTTVANYVFASGLTAEQKAKIQALSVLWLKCGDYKLEELPHDAGSEDVKEITPDYHSERKCKPKYLVLCLILDIFSTIPKPVQQAELEPNYGDTTGQEYPIGKTKSRK